MKKHQPLTKLERELLNKLDESSGAMKQADQQLQENHKEIARLKAKLTDPQLPQGFKCSPATQHALSTSKALLATAQRLLQEEINHHISTQLQGIADRTTKALKKMEYQKALAGPYSVAVLAINRKREEVSQTGIIIDTHVNGPVKALIDWNSKEIGRAHV